MPQAFESMFCPVKNGINKPSLGQEKYTIGKELGAGSEGLSQLDAAQKQPVLQRLHLLLGGFLLFWQDGIDKCNENVMYHRNRAEA